ncbi:MAG: RsmE family RNA methyltransferase [Candidatus Sulfotelmatobacter sp.]
MTRRRWIADEVSESHAALLGEHADHLIRVLRARVGQEFDMATGSSVRRGRIISIGDGRVEFELGETLVAHFSANITLLLSIFKFDRMEWAIEKCTELGVTKIVPVIARRTAGHLATASAKRVERWRKIALQAAEQSRRSAVAEITPPMKVRQAVKFAGAPRILLNESEQEDTLREVLSAHKGENEILLAIGPEGGWAEDELQLFINEGWISASLGSTILRVETTAIAATAITMAE